MAFASSIFFRQKLVLHQAAKSGLDASCLPRLKFYVLVSLLSYKTAHSSRSTLHYNNLVAQCILGYRVSMHNKGARSQAKER